MRYESTVFSNLFKESKVKGFVTDIETDTVNNTNFRKVLYTAENCQLVLMSLKPGEDIGEEVHDVDQFFRIDSGLGEAIINGNSYVLKNGSAVVIPAGATHNIINTGKKDLKMYSIYSPPHHKDKTVHKTKNDASEDDEEFDGDLTEE